MSVATARDGLKTRLETITGLHAYDIWPDSPILPAALVRPVRGTYHRALAAGGLNITFEVVVLVQISNLALAQDALDAYLDDTGASSVKAAIEGGPTLSGAADDLVVNGFTEYDVMAVNGVDYLGVKFEVEVQVA